MSFTRLFLLVPVFFRTGLPGSGDYHLERVGCRYMMRLGKAVKRAQILKSKAQMSSIWAKGCMLMIVWVLSILTSLVEGESVVCYYYYKVQ